MQTVTEGTLLWEPSEEFRERANLTRYMRWLREERGLSFEDYHELWRWSVESLEDFWGSLWEYCGVLHDGSYERVLAERTMPGARWFEGTRLNYAEHIFRKGSPQRSALVHASELRPLGQESWGELESRVASLAAGLRELGVGRGDRVVAYLPNIPEAIEAFLACASIGAIWSSCSPDFGVGSVVDRFRQIEPKVLLAVDGYRYGGRDYDRMEVVARIEREIPSLEKTVLLPYLGERPDVARLGNAMGWEELLASGEGAPLTFERVPFDHPLWVLYSSGTTGLPKAIVQGHGGILLEHLKQIELQMDLGEDDRFFWFTTTGWMMWNIVVAGLLSGAAALLYDGNPGYPDMYALWRFAGETGMTHFGTSAAYITACMKAGIEPGRELELPRLRAIGSTGSPLPPEGFTWAYEHVRRDHWLFSTSGGTDLCTAFVGGCPLLPVRAGELQCRALGAKVEAFDEEGNPLVDEVGELVITEPMPSMPLYLWGDESGERYRESYFSMYPGVWRHGDWIKIKKSGSCVIYGRSDSTINRGGVRMGTAEIYSAVESVPEVLDSLVVDVQRPDGTAYMPLFVVLREGVDLTAEIEAEIKRRIREYCSPRHVPDEILAVPEIPKTLNGKRLEVPVKRILSGTPPEKAASRDALANPRSLDVFVELARREES